MGFFDKIKASLTRTKEQFVERFDEIVGRADEPAQRVRPIDVETVEALEEALISADVGVAATDRIVEAVRKQRTPRRVAARRWSRRRSSAILRAADQRRAPNGQHAARGADRRRQRHRQDDHGRQARAADQGLGEDAADLRGRHVSRRGGRAAAGLGDPRRRRLHPRAGRRRPGRGRVRRASPPARRAGATSCSWTPPAGCTLAST